MNVRISNPLAVRVVGDVATAVDGAGADLNGRAMIDVAEKLVRGGFRRILLEEGASLAGAPPTRRVRPSCGRDS